MCVMSTTHAWYFFSGKGSGNTQSQVLWLVHMAYYSVCSNNPANDGLSNKPWLKAWGRYLFFFLWSLHWFLSSKGWTKCIRCCHNQKGKNCYFFFFLSWMWRADRCIKFYKFCTSGKQSKVKNYRTTNWCSLIFNFEQHECWLQNGAREQKAGCGLPTFGLSSWVVLAMPDDVEPDGLMETGGISPPWQHRELMIWNNVQSPSCWIVYSGNVTPFFSMCIKFIISDVVLRIVSF